MPNARFFLHSSAHSAIDRKFITTNFAIATTTDQLNKYKIYGTAVGVDTGMEFKCTRNGNKNIIIDGTQTVALAFQSCNAHTHTRSVDSFLFCFFRVFLEKLTSALPHSTYDCLKPFANNKIKSNAEESRGKKSRKTWQWRGANNSSDDDDEDDNNSNNVQEGANKWTTQTIIV